MTIERHKIIVSLYLVLEKDGHFLLSLRHNTGYEDGNYGLVSGHLEARESVIQGMIREAKEEIGITIDPKNLSLVHVLHRNADRVDLFFKVSQWEGEIQNLEPKKCRGVSFFPMDRLPNNLVGYIGDVLGLIEQGVIYSDSGFEKERVLL